MVLLTSFLAPIARARASFFKEGAVSDVELY